MLSLSLAALTLGVSNVAAQNNVSPQHFYELGIEVNGSGLSLAIYDALAGGPALWSGPITETGGSPDIQFDTNGQGGPDIIDLPPGLLLLVFTPLACDGDPGCVVLSAPITYAWAGNSTPLSVGSFYRPASGGFVDTDFSLSNGTLNVHTNDSSISGNINTYLGATGWTLPYDRVALCALTTCAGNGPASQFFSAGVQTEPYNGGKRLVPTFAFKGSVAPLTSWGAQNWNVSGLTLRFLSGKILTVAGTLSATGTTFTAVDASQGWGGMRFDSGSGGTIASSIIERVRAYGGPALTITGASPTIFNTEIRDSPCCGVSGVSITGSTASPTLEGNTISGMSQGGVVVQSYAQPHLIRNIIRNNTGDGISAGFQTGPFLAPAASTGGRTGNDIVSNGGVGVFATSSAYVNYSWYYYSVNGYHNDGYNLVASNVSNGNVATGNAAVAAGNSGNQRRNGFYFNAQGSSTGKDATASGSGSRAYVTCNYWGPGSSPPFRTSATSGGVLYNTSYLAQDPRVNPFAPCLPIGGAARAAPTAQTSDAARLAVLADATSVENPAEALAALTDVLASGGPLVAPALAEVGWLARRSGAPAEATRVLESYAAGTDPVARTAALAALVGVRGASGDDAGSLRAADALVATDDPEAVLYGQVARVYLLTESGRSSEAAEALAAVEALAPGSRESVMARSSLGLTTADAVQISVARSTTPVAASRGVESGDDAVTELSMGTARPNPTSGRAIVPLSLPAASHVRLSLYDVLGREAAVLVDGQLAAGRHGVALETRDLAPGVYVLRGVVETDAGVVALAGRVTVAR